ncbi:uncharacterized protein LOC106157510 [Lingula anatina]|uniref:Uncharacterized protein LOC106157510 n=1 Tax=Lingula anatina TaxID=7574 RepID=A0A1S3HRI5_LINAN|nr:uncharacterized protein LOC106157510 [Lingula anatina]|eukprot:XP_013388643.1 uncharacterized protein LOC106157510 [Lingula anatina]
MLSAFNRLVRTENDVKYGPRHIQFYFSLLAVLIIQSSLLVSVSSYPATTCAQRGLLDKPCGSGGKFKEFEGCCQKCTTCPPGYGVNPNSSEYCVLECIPCEHGSTFSDVHKAALCMPCAHCDLRFRHWARQCTSTQNALCGVCLDGYYEITDRDNIPEPVCQKCTPQDNHPHCHLYFKKLKTTTPTYTSAADYTTVNPLTRTEPIMMQDTIPTKTDSLSITIATGLSVLALICLIPGIIATIFICKRYKLAKYSLTNAESSVSSSSFGTEATSCSKSESQEICSNNFTVFARGDVKNKELPRIPVPGLAQSLGHVKLQAKQHSLQHMEDPPQLENLKLPSSNHSNKDNNSPHHQPYEGECNCCLDTRTNGEIDNQQHICLRCHKKATSCICGDKKRMGNFENEPSTSDMHAMKITLREESESQEDVVHPAFSCASCSLKDDSPSRDFNQKDMLLLGPNDQKESHTMKATCSVNIPTRSAESLTDNTQTVASMCYYQQVFNMHVYKEALEIARDIKTEDWCYNCQEMLAKYLDPDNTIPACGKSWFHFGLASDVGLTHRDLQNMREGKPYSKTLAILQKMTTLNKSVDSVLKTLKYLERFDALDKICTMLVDKQKHGH